MGRMYSAGPQASRLAWHDRNPINRPTNVLVPAAAPHSTTERWTWTVPAGKKAYVEFLSTFIVRITAATTVGIAKLVFCITPSGGTKTRIIYAELYTNVAYDRERTNLPTAITLLAGDAISAETEDTSTGGTVTYLATVKITEFDA